MLQSPPRNQYFGAGHMEPTSTSPTRATPDDQRTLTLAAVIRANRERRETPPALFADWAHI